MKKQFCKYCGGKLGNDTKKCTKCGRFNGKPVKPKNNENHKEKKPFKLSKGVFIIALTFSLIVGAGVAFGITYWAYERDSGIIAEKEEDAEYLGYRNGYNSGYVNGRKDTFDNSAYEQGYNTGYLDGKYSRS